MLREQPRFTPQPPTPMLPPLQERNALDRLDEEDKMIESRARVARSNIEREGSGRSRSGDVGYIEQTAIQCFVWNVKQCSISTTSQMNQVSQAARKSQMMACTCDAPSKKVHVLCTDAQPTTSSGTALTINDIADVEGGTYRRRTTDEKTEGSVVPADAPYLEAADRPV